MSLVDDHNRQKLMNAAHKLNLTVQLAFSVAPVKLRFAVKLLEQPLVKMPRRQLRI